MIHNVAKTCDTCNTKADTLTFLSKGALHSDEVQNVGVTVVVVTCVLMQHSLGFSHLAHQLLTGDRVLYISYLQQ